MRILFVDPPGWQKGLNVGLAYMSACLIENGFEIRVADLNNGGGDFNSLKETAAHFKPDIVGFSIKSNSAKISGELGKLIKDSFSDIYLVAGGPHISISGEEFLRDNPFFDLLVVGETEKNISEIFRLLIKDKSLKNSPFPRSSNNKIVYLDFVEELDTLPLPNYDVFTGVDIKQFAWPLLTSRGCPYHCYYCCVGKLSGKSVRMRSPENVIEELKTIKMHFGLSAFEVIDDNFTFDIARAKKICDLLLEEKLSFEWSCPNGIRADRMDRQLAQKMKASGCRMVTLGIESADEAVFNRIGKGESLADIVKAIGILKEAGMKVGGFFIIGLIGDTRASVNKSIAFARKMKLDNALFNMLIPYPGTALWDWAKDHGIHIGDYTKSVHFSNAPEPAFETAELRKKEKIDVYNMAHVRVGRIELLLPEYLTLWQRRKQIMLLCWRYDKLLLIKFIFGFFINKVKKLFRKGKDA